MFYSRVGSETADGGCEFEPDITSALCSAGSWDGSGSSTERTSEVAMTDIVWRSYELTLTAGTSLLQTVPTAPPFQDNGGNGTSLGLGSGSGSSSGSGSGSESGSGRAGASGSGNGAADSASAAGQWRVGGTLLATAAAAAALIAW